MFDIFPLLGRERSQLRLSITAVLHGRTAIPVSGQPGPDLPSRAAYANAKKPTSQKLDRRSNFWGSVQ